MNFWKNFSKQNNLIAAHRGVRSVRAENTMSAFKEAIKRGADFLELDVGFSKDGVAIIIHDDTLERTSDVKEHSEFVKPYRVVDYTFDELSKLDFSSWFLESDPFGSIKDGRVSKKELEDEGVQRILTLKEALEFVKEHSFAVNIEIKDMRGTPFDKIAVKKVIEVINEVGDIEDLILISSFNHDYIKEASVLAPNITRAALQEDNNPDDLINHLRSINAHGYHPELKITDREQIKALNNAGFFVNVYTVNDKNEKKRLFKEGVKASFSDFV